MRTRQRNLGTRHLCHSCGTKFYDLGKSHPTCPRCAAPAHDEDGDPAASALARAKAEGPRKFEEEDEAPLGKPESTEEAEESEGLNELGGDLTEETSAEGTDYDYDD